MVGLSEVYPEKDMWSYLCPKCSKSKWGFRSRNEASYALKIHKLEHEKPKKIG